MDVHQTLCHKSNDAGDLFRLNILLCLTCCQQDVTSVLLLLLQKSVLLLHQEESQVGAGREQTDGSLLHHNVPVGLLAKLGEARRQLETSITNLEPAIACLDELWENKVWINILYGYLCKKCSWYVIVTGLG